MILLRCRVIQSNIHKTSNVVKVRSGNESPSLAQASSSSSVTLVLSSEPGVGLVRFDCGGAERVPSAAEVFVEGFKIDETFGRLGAGITWQEWKNGGKD